MDQTRPVVLIVDDNRTIRSMLDQALDEFGFKVYQAENGEKAISLFQTINPDLILLDVEMPGIDGFTVCTRIRELDKGKNTPIAMTTGNDDINSINKAYEVGATDFIAKPINWNHIGYHLRNIIRNGHHYQELQKRRDEVEKAQDEIKKMNELLEQRVTERTEQLNNTLEKLRNTQTQLIESEKMASLGELVAGLSHEINTPLGVCVTTITHLQGELELSKKFIRDNTLKKSDLDKFMNGCAEAMHMLQINLMRTSEIIKNFKLVSVDQITEAQRIVELKNYIDEIVYSLRPILKKSNSHIVTDCPKDIEINSYPGVLFRVISILVMNSVTHAFNPDQNGTITITVTQENNTIQLCYADNGKGIPKANIKKIFDPFFTTKRAEGNVGLGLNIAYNQVTQVLSGTIRCESEIGKGTTFIITFPKTLASRPHVNDRIK